MRPRRPEAAAARVPAVARAPARPRRRPPRRAASDPPPGAAPRAGPHAVTAERPLTDSGSVASGAPIPSSRRCAMARLTPDPTFYPSPAEAAAAPAETHAYVVTLNTGTNGDRAPDALTVIDLQDGSSTYGQLVGRLDMPERRRRAAPLRLERVLVGAVPVGAAPARRAPLPARPGPALLEHPRRRHQGRRAEARQDDRRGRDRRARPATRARTRSTAGPTGSTSRRSATPRATARAASSCSTTTTSRSRARGRTTAARRSWPTTSGGTSTTAR